MTLQEQADQWAWWAAAAAYMVYASLLYLAYAIAKWKITNRRIKEENTLQGVHKAIRITRSQINYLDRTSPGYTREMAELRAKLAALYKQKEFLDF